MKYRTNALLAWALVVIQLAIVIAHSLVFISQPTAIGIFWVAYTLGLLGPTAILAALETLKWWDKSDLRLKFNKHLSRQRF